MKIEIPDKNTYIEVPDDTTPEEASQLIAANWDNIPTREKPSSFESFVNAIRKEPARNLRDFQSLFGGFEAAERGEYEAELEAPSEGVGGFLGSAVANVAPTAAALGAAALGGPLTAAAASLGLMAYYGLRGAGGARQAVYQYEQETGEDVSAGAEALATLGVGVVNAGLGYLPMKTGQMLTRGLTKEVVKELGEAAAQSAVKKNPALLKGVMQKTLKPLIVQSMAEGGEEAAEQFMQNVIEGFFYDKDRNPFEGVAQAGALGMVGGALLTPLSTIPAKRDAKAQDKWLREKGLRGTQQKQLEANAGPSSGSLTSFPSGEVATREQMASGLVGDTKRLENVRLPQFVPVNQVAEEGTKDLYFQKGSGKIPADSEYVRAQVEHFEALGFPLNGVEYSTEQLYTPEGEAVNAFLNVQTGRVTLSPFVDLNTFPHEILEAYRLSVGEDDPMIRRGMDLVGGDKEELFDRLGDLIDGKIQNKNLFQTLTQWLREFWSYAKETLGMELNLQDVANRIHARIKNGIEAPKWCSEQHVGPQEAVYQSLRPNLVKTGLRFFNNLAAIKGRVNLDQLPLKNVSKEETEFVKAVAEELKAEGKKTMMAEEFQGEVMRRLLPVEVKIESNIVKADPYDYIEQLQTGKDSVDLPNGMVLRRSGDFYTLYDSADAYFSNQGRQLSATEVGTYLDKLFRGKSRTLTTVGNQGHPPDFGVSAAHRYMFETPIDFGEEAHGGIPSTTAAGWFEAGALDADEKTLVVFEVQPSDSVKVMQHPNFDYTVESLKGSSDVMPIRDEDGGGFLKYYGNENSFIIMKDGDYTVITPETAKTLVDNYNFKKDPAKGNMYRAAPTINRYFYRSIIQWAAKNGFERVRFPVGESVEEIEGVEGTIQTRLMYRNHEVIVRDNTLYEKGSGKKLLEITNPKVFDELDKVYNTVFDNSGYRSELLDSMGIYYEGQDISHGTVQLANNLAARMEKEYKGRTQRVGEDEQRPFLEVSLRPEDASTPALLFQRSKPSDYVGSVNMNYFNVDKNTEGLIRAVFHNMEAYVESWGETERKAHQHLSNHLHMMNIITMAENGKALNAGEGLALRLLAHGASLRVMRAIEENETEGNIKDVVNSMNRIFRAESREAGTAGRALNARKIYLNKDLRDVVARWASAAIQERGELTPEQRKRYNELIAADLLDPFEVHRFKKSLAIPKWYEYIQSVFYSSLVSTPRLLFFENPGVNALWSVYLSGHRVITGGVDALRSGITGKPRQVYAGEGFKMLKQMLPGMKKGWARVPQVLKTGQTPPLETRWEYDISDSIMSAFQRSPNASLRWLAPAVDMPFRVLKALDVLGKTAAADMQLNALAYRQAKKAGLSAGSPDFDEFVSKFVKNPPEAANKNIGTFAKGAVFVSDPGTFTRWLLNLKEKSKVGFMVVPFVTTVANMLKEGLQLTPGVGYAVSRYRGVSSVSAIAKQVEGTILMGLLMSLFDDDKLTGAAPQNAAERDAWRRQGKQPLSMRVGDTWIPYRALGPFAIPITALATGMDTMRRATNQEEGTEIFNRVFQTVIQSFIESSYFRNLAALFDEQDRSIALKRIPVGFVPYSGFLRGIADVWEQTSTGDVKARETQGFLDEMANVIPGLRGGIKERVNAYGESYSKPGGVWAQWLPAYPNVEMDGVESELKRLNEATQGGMGYPALPDRFIQIGGGKYALPEDVFQQFAVSYGRATKTALAKVMSSPSYGRWSDEAKTKALHRELARHRALENKKLLRAVLKSGDLRSLRVAPLLQ